MPGRRGGGSTEGRLDGKERRWDGHEESEGKVRRRRRRTWRRKRALPWSGSWILYLMVVISLLMAGSEGKKGEAVRARLRALQEKSEWKGKAVVVVVA